MITVSLDNGIATLTLNDGKGNALSARMLGELDSALDRALPAKVVVLGGREKVFCGGLDLPEVVQHDRAGMDQFLALFDRVFHRLLAYPRPIITFARGSAVAGGAILLCAGDRRLMTPAGMVGITESTLGMCFPTPALELVRVAIGDERLTEAATLGRLYDGADRLRIGFATDIVEPDAIAVRAQEIAREYTTLDPDSIGRIRLQLRRAAITRSQANMDADRAEFLDRWFAPFAQERLRAVVARLSAR